MRGLRGIVAGLAAAAALAPAGAQAAPAPGQLLTFGNNANYQLGTSQNPGIPFANPTPTAVALPAAAGAATIVSMSQTHTLVATTSGTVYAFGANSVGELGNGGASTYVPAPVTLPGQTGSVVNVIAGDAYSVVLTSTGQLYEFGYNASGELGFTHDTNPHPTPTLVSLPGQSGTIVQVAAGESQVLALTSAGQLYGWGSDGNGELADPGHSNWLAPQQITLPGMSGTISHIATGHGASFASTTAGQLYSWGNDLLGQLGYTIPSQVHDYTPQLVTLPSGAGAVTAISAGWNHTLVLTSSGQLYAFGDNTCGVFGSLAAGGPTPTSVSWPSGVTLVAIHAGYDHSEVLTNEGTLYVFGCNYYGQLGNAANNLTNNANPSPVLLTGVPVNTTFDALNTAAGLAQSEGVVVADLTASAQALPVGHVGSPYAAPAATASGGTAPITWSASGLPAGLTINASTGQLTGTPTQSGAFAPTFTATDAYGVHVVATGTLTIGPPLPGSTTPTASVTGFSQSHARWREGSKHTKHSPPRGTTFTITLSAAGNVTLTFQRQVSGRSVHGRCVAATRTNTHARRCRRTVPAGTLTVDGRAGANNVSFSGRLGDGRMLATGTYTVLAGTAGGTARQLTFTIGR